MPRRAKTYMKIANRTIKFPIAAIVYAIESSRHLRVMLLRASLNSLINLKALSALTIPADSGATRSSIREAKTMIRSKMLNLSFFHSWNFNPVSLTIHSMVNKYVNAWLVYDIMSNSGEGYWSVAKINVLRIISNMMKVLKNGMWITFQHTVHIK